MSLLTLLLLNWHERVQSTWYLSKTGLFRLYSLYLLLLQTQKRLETDLAIAIDHYLVICSWVQVRLIKLTVIHDEAVWERLGCSNNQSVTVTSILFTTHRKLWYFQSLNKFSLIPYIVGYFVSLALKWTKKIEFAFGHATKTSYF